MSAFFVGFTWQPKGCRRNRNAHDAFEDIRLSGFRGTRCHHLFCLEQKKLTGPQNHEGRFPPSTTLARISSVPPNMPEHAIRLKRAASLWLLLKSTEECHQNRNVVGFSGSSFQVFGPPWISVFCLASL